MASTVQRSSNGTLKKLKLKCVQYEVKEPGLISEYYFFGGGDTPPAETADSGLSSDGTGEGFTPPPLIRRMTASNNNNAGRPSGRSYIILLIRIDSSLRFCTVWSRTVGGRCVVIMIKTFLIHSIFGR